MVTALAAGAAMAQAGRPARGAQQPARMPAASMSGVEEAVSRASAAESKGMANSAGSSIMPASMSSWVGPVTKDELRQVPRKLSSEERNLLRQEIRSASEEVYEEYRRRKP